MKMRAVGVFLAVGLIWGSAWIPSSVVRRQDAALEAGALRFAMAAVVLGVAALARYLRARRQNRRVYGGSPGWAEESTSLPIFASVGLGVTMIAMPYALGVWAAGEVAPGIVATIYAALPLMALFLSGEGSSAEIPALVIGLGGVAMLVAPGFSASVAQIKGGAMLLGGIALEAWSLVYAKKILAKKIVATKVLRGTDLVGSAAIQFAVAATLLGLLSIGEMTLVLDGQTLLSLLGLALVVSAATLPMMYWLLERMDPWRVAALQWVATLVAVTEGGWFLHVRPSFEMWLGAALIVATIVWLLRRNAADELQPLTLEITNDAFPGPGASHSEVD